MATVVQLFETRNQAQRAIEALRQAGIPAEDISFVAQDRGGSTQVTHTESAAADGAGKGPSATTLGAAGGGLLGGVAGLLAGVGGLAIPGIGPALAAGPIAGLLAGGAVGLGAGGVVGALVDLGVPEEEAPHYQAGLERGGILLMARVPDGREREARDLLEGVGARDLDYHRRQWAADPGFRYDDRDALPPAPRAEPARVVESDSAGGAAGGALVGGAGAALIGGLAGGPVGALAGAAVGALAGATVGEALGFEIVEPEFRRDWESGPGRDRVSWDQASLAYRHGWEGRQHPDHRGRSWDEARPALRGSWRAGMAWDEAEPFVRRGWERRASQPEA